MDRLITYSNGLSVFTLGKLLNGFINKNGYRVIDLYKNCKSTKISIHRLVAQAFIPNPNNYPIINHKDENPLNNNVDNLEWCTYKYNNNYGHHKENSSISHTNNINTSIPILQYDLNGNYIATYPSAREIQRQLNIPATSITRNCKGIKTQTCHGYVWKYANNKEGAKYK